MSRARSRYQTSSIRKNANPTTAAAPSTKPRGGPETGAGSRGASRAGRHGPRSCRPSSGRIARKAAQALVAFVRALTAMSRDSSPRWPALTALDCRWNVC
jgi:hypothetical protein